MKRILKTVATSVATAALLATPTMAEEPKKGGTLTMAIQQTPRHLNPAVQSGTATGQPGTQLFASLLRYDEGWNPQPFLAETWEVSADGLSVTINLVKGATFHDGAPITSEDVAFSIDTESGFDRAVFITSSYGLGEAVVSGAVNPDEFYVYKPNLASNKSSILRRVLGDKAEKIIFADDPDKLVVTVPVDAAERVQFSLNDEDVVKLAVLVAKIETHYQKPMDVEWGKDVLYNTQTPWHCREIDGFQNWLAANKFDPYDPKLSLGYLKLGEVDLLNSFGTTDAQEIWKQMGNYLDIYKIECGTSSATYDYHWSDADHEQRQLESLR